MASCLLETCYEYTDIMYLGMYIRMCKCTVPCGHINMYVHVQNIEFCSMQTRLPFDVCLFPTQFTYK